MLAMLLSLALVATACGGSDDDDGESSSGPSPGVSKEKIDYEAIGLWDDGPCDTAKEPLKIGLMTVFESPVISLGDQATALEASAEAFNRRGGANGSCVEVHHLRRRRATSTRPLAACGRSTTPAWWRPSTTRAPPAGRGVGAPWPNAKIPRVAANVAQDDWGDPNAYPLDASGTGVTFLLPQALIDAGAKKIGLIRVDLPQRARWSASSPTRTRARPPSPTTSRFPAAPPTSPSSSWGRRTPEPRAWSWRSASRRPSRS